MGSDFGVCHRIANQGRDAVEDGIVIVIDAVIERQIGGTNGARGLAHRLGVAARGEEQHRIEVGVESPLGAARIFGLIFEGVVGANADLKMQVSIGGGAGLSHDADLGAARDGVALGVAGNQIIGAGPVGGGFVVPQVEIPRVKFGYVLAVLG